MWGPQVCPESLKGKEKLLIFPEGTRHEEIGEGKTGAAMMAIRTGVPCCRCTLPRNGPRSTRTKVYIGEPYQPLQRPPGHSGGL